MGNPAGNRPKNLPSVLPVPSLTSWAGPCGPVAPTGPVGPVLPVWFQEYFFHPFLHFFFCFFFVVRILTLPSFFFTQATTVLAWAGTAAPMPTSRPAPRAAASPTRENRVNIRGTSTPLEDAYERYTRPPGEGYVTDSTDQRHGPTVTALGRRVSDV